MEKLVCAACGAPLSVDTALPVITCEYCETPMENKFYIAPAEPVPAAEAAIEDTVNPEESMQESGGGILLKTIVGVGTAIAASKLRANARAASRTVHPVRSAAVPRVRQPASQVLRRGSEHIVQSPRPSMPRPMDGMPGRGFGSPAGAVREDVARAAVTIADFPHFA